MPLVKPNYTDSGMEREPLVPGRYVLRITGAEESEKLDSKGYNALVVKFETIENKNTKLNGKKISRWLPLGGAGAKVLFRFMKCVDVNYSGGAFTTESLIGKVIEGDIILEINPKDGKQWLKVNSVYPYLPVGSVATTFAGNVTDEKDVPSFDDFDTN